MASFLETKSRNATFLSVISFSLLLFLQLVGVSLSRFSSGSKVHIIYMGRRPHDDVELLTSITKCSPVSLEDSYNKNSSDQISHSLSLLMSPGPGQRRSSCRVNDLQLQAWLFWFCRKAD
ncbi:hypothetical protein M9H77_26313 [Catharanthus roseus]|uniref:Uncharacterized protein n=1 Tax=Catharanthus roseus TaxID=4058 RepID=A0ACC0A9E5_CATRO|nr:hypothetical protein M9H77_26313 [Catharanthus roseus]